VRHDARVGTAAPLVVTAVLDALSQQRFDDLRRRHFPPERNQLAAHITLFHALPGEHEAAVGADLADVVGTAYDVEVCGVRFLGRGVAYDLRSPELHVARQELARRWAPWLTPQDRQRFRAHVTVQNKVAPDVARRLHGQLAAAFAPYVVRVEGLALWRYLGGPWEPVGSFPTASDRG
jgi:2'-5' RNA ligase